MTQGNTGGALHQEQGSTPCVLGPLHVACGIQSQDSRHQGERGQSAQATSDQMKAKGQAVANQIHCQVPVEGKSQWRPPMLGSYSSF